MQNHCQHGQDRCRTRRQHVPAQGETRSACRACRTSATSRPTASASEPSAAHGQSRTTTSSGRGDTDKGPVLDATYDKLREGADAVKKFSPDGAAARIASITPR